ncbi:MAG: CRISPR-associated protein Csx15 [Thermomicrobiales bacterium]
MIIINFSHPLTDDQLQAIERAGGESIQRVIAAPAHFHEDEPYLDQIRDLVRHVGLSSHQWQTEPILINPPAYAPIAVSLQTYLHGLAGGFLPVIRLRPVLDSPVRRYEFAEILDLQGLYRDSGREARREEASDGR